MIDGEIQGYPPGDKPCSLHTTAEVAAFERIRELENQDAWREKMESDSEQGSPVQGPVWEDGSFNQESGSPPLEKEQEDPSQSSDEGLDLPSLSLKDAMTLHARNTARLRIYYGELVRRLGAQEAEGWAASVGLFR